MPTTCNLAIRLLKLRKNCEPAPLDVFSGVRRWEHTGF